MLIETGIMIDGVDITSLIAAEGVDWSRNDVDGPNAGRNLNAREIRDRIDTKIRLDITCRKLTWEELQRLAAVLYPEFVSVTYDDPLFGHRSAMFYCSKQEAGIFRRRRSTEQWTPKPFALVEQ